MRTNTLNETCRQGSLSRRAGAAALGRHRDVVPTGTLQARDGAREVRRGAGFGEAIGARHRRCVGGGAKRCAPGGPERVRAAVRRCRQALRGARCWRKTSLHVVKQNKVHRNEHPCISFITSVKSLWGAILSTAAARGSFDGDVIRPSALKTTQHTAGTAGVAHD